ncbi:MAG TPA: hypothetical protein VF337_03510 [Candidatus Limnocylindrales bacterium]
MAQLGVLLLRGTRLRDERGEWLDFFDLMLQRECIFRPIHFDDTAREQIGRSLWG